MKRRHGSTLALFAVAGLAALLAASLAYAYLEKRLAEQRHELGRDVVEVAQAPDRYSIVALGRDVYRGKRLEADDLALLQVPLEGAPPEGVLTRPQEAIGQIALQPLYRGEWLVGRKLASADGPREGLGNLLAGERRAVRLPVDQVSGLLGILEPDDRVDVIGVFPAADGRQTVSRTVLQNVAVLAVGMAGVPGAPETAAADATATGRRASTVTLELDPRESELLALALAVGSVQLALRNKADTATPPSRGVRIGQLEKVALPAPERAPERAVKTVEVIHGRQVRHQTIP